MPCAVTPTNVCNFVWPLEGLPCLRRIGGGARPWPDAAFRNLGMPADDAETQDLDVKAGQSRRAAATSPGSEVHAARFGVRRTKRASSALEAA